MTKLMAAHTSVRGPAPWSPARVGALAVLGLGLLLAGSAPVRAEGTAAAAAAPAAAGAAPAAGNAAPAAGGAAPVSTQALAPDVLVKTVSSEVLDIIRSDKDIQSGDQRKVMELVKDKVLPHFDFARMTALAVGSGWRRATQPQQEQLIDEFRTLLVRTYSSGLSAYRNQTIDFKPLRMNQGDTEVLVRSEVKQPAGQPVTIDYRMAKTAEGWKVYDVAIGGVSLVTTYRDSFGQEVRQSGVDGLIKSLTDKNRQLEKQQSARK